MVLLNQATREITAKVVYYGPGLCGKTSNIQFIYDTLDEDQRGRMLSLATDTDRTLFFDFMPMELGSVRGFKVRIQLYTVPGQVFYAETRKRVLKGADGVVFVADSQKTMRQANKESFRELKEHLTENGLDTDTIPTVLQYNKRDIKDISTVEEMDSDLNTGNIPFFEAIAKEGVGVEDTLRCISKLVLKKLMGQALEAAPPRAVIPKPRPALTDTVVMDHQKLLSELGVAGSLGKNSSQVTNPTVAPPPPPILSESLEEEDILTDVGNADGPLLDSAQDLLGLDDGGADLLGGEEEIPLSAMDSSQMPLPLPEPLLLEDAALLPGGELGLLEDPPTLDTDSRKTIFEADSQEELEEIVENSPQPVGISVTPGTPLEIELLAGGRRFKLTIRLDELG